MLNNVYFLTVDYIKKYYSGYLDKNVDSDALSSFILTSQAMRTQNILGYDLYTKYINDINTYDAPQGAPYIFLMDNYIQPALALWTLYEALPLLDTKITNKGVVNMNTNYSKTAEERRFDKILNQLNNNAGFYDTRIIEYIMNYPSEFPEYFTQTGVNRIRPKKDPYFAGLWLPDVVLTPKKKGGFDTGPGCCNGGGFYLY